MPAQRNLTKCRNFPAVADRDEPLGHFEQAMPAQRPSGFSTRGYHQDCRNRELRVTASAANPARPRGAP